MISAIQANFDAAISSIPDGADVVFVFGEIDCREGLLVAVERAHYTDVNHGTSVVVEIYVDALVKVAKERPLRLLVHPVPPLLNETRAIVKPFNATLQAAPIPALSPRPRRPDAPRSPPTCSIPVLLLFSSTRVLRPRH